MGQRRDGYEDLDDIDTTYSPGGSGDHVWVQRSRTLIRRCHAWALVCYVCDHRWPPKSRGPDGGYRWERIVSLRRYRYAFGRWKEKSAINFRADDMSAIMTAIEGVSEIKIGEPNPIARALQTA